VRRSCHTIARPDGHAGDAIPEHDRLALVGDAERVGHEAALRDRFACGVERARENFVGVVLDLAGFGKVLRDFPVAASGDAAIRGDHQARRAGGAFVNRENAFHR
jgi:hypothetical protein